MTVPARQTASDPFDLEVEQTILAYLEEHPAAMDSVKGIIEWWLPRQASGWKSVEWNGYSSARSKRGF